MAMAISSRRLIFFCLRNEKFFKRTLTIDGDFSTRQKSSSKDKFPSSMTSARSLSVLNDHYPTIVNDLLTSYSSESSTNIYLEKILAHFANVIDYNAVDGKKLRGAMVVETVRALSSTEDQNLLKKAAVVGWCIELRQASFLVVDDFMAHSKTRRGKPCWYLHVKEKETSINDSFFLYSCTFTLLNKYFADNIRLNHLFNEVFQRTVVGQGLDLETPNFLPSIDLYTEEHYLTVVTWKTAFYTIVLPIISGLLIGPTPTLADHPRLKSILIEIGIYFQIQDDFLDCFGDLKQTGKIGTDIEERKCSWLIVQAMKILHDQPEKKEILKDNYGFDDQEKVQIVKNIYREIDLERVYQKFDNETYEKLSRQIEEAQFNNSQLESLLKSILDRLHSRNK